MTGDDGLDVTCYRGIGSFLFAMDLYRSRTSNLAGFSITLHKNYFIIPANPATGIVYITENSPRLYFRTRKACLISNPTNDNIDVLFRIRSLESLRLYLCRPTFCVDNDSQTTLATLDILYVSGS
jgi:hypothetical protein